MMNRFAGGVRVISPDVTTPVEVNVSNGERPCQYEQQQPGNPFFMQPPHVHFT
jgi:hypothetical protein